MKRMGSYNSPFISIDRSRWSNLCSQAQQPLSEQELIGIRGLDNPLTTEEVKKAYLPLSQLLLLRFAASSELHRKTNTFLETAPKKTPFIIGIAGSVAAGKSTVARLLRELLRRGPHQPDVQLVTTDGFLYPQAELERRGLKDRKGFPESYDQRRLLKFVHDVKSGEAFVKAPWYSHEHYDIVPGKEIVVNNPDILLIEGLNVLAPARLLKEAADEDQDLEGKGSRNDLGSLAINDFFDFSIYLDAQAPYLEKWYVDRFLRLRSTAFVKPSSYFHRYANLSDAEATGLARHIWSSINKPNLAENILPTRNRADLILIKGPDHAMRRVLLRKI